MWNELRLLHCVFQRANLSPEGLKDISGEQWLFGAFSAADSSFSAIQETVNVRRGRESGNNQLNSFLKGRGAAETWTESSGFYSLFDSSSLFFIHTLKLTAEKVKQESTDEEKTWTNEWKKQFDKTTNRLSFSSTDYWVCVCVREIESITVSNTRPALISLLCVCVWRWPFSCSELQDLWLWAHPHCADNILNKMHNLVQFPPKFRHFLHPKTKLYNLNNMLHLLY